MAYESNHILSRKNALKFLYETTTLKLKGQSIKINKGHVTFYIHKKKELRNKVGPETFNSRKLRFLARTLPFEQRNATTDFIYYFFA